MPDNAILRNIMKYLKFDRIKALVFVFVFILFFINTFETNFPDEFDNIVGGLYITKGVLPYKGFFSHHGPVAYLIASPITLFTQQSFVNFRIVFSAILSLFLLGNYLILKRQLKTQKITEFLYYLILLGLSATYFWGHMLLADSLSGYLLIPAYVLIFLKSVKQQKLTFIDIGIVSILTSLTFFTSITYSYVVLIMNLFVLFIYLLQHKKNLIHADTLKVFLIFLIPYLIFLMYFLVTGSLKQYIQQGILYNKNIYIYNYPRPEGSTSLNPLRYAIVIFHQFYGNYRGLLEQVKDFNFAYPFNITLAVINISLLAFLLIQKNYSLFLFVLGLLIFSNPRSNPLNSKETDFQSSVYIMLSLFNLPLILLALKNELNKVLPFAKKLIFSLLFIISTIYTFFFVLYIFNAFFEKTYQKYMGMAPLIYDRPQVAPLINKLITKDDYFWIGPHEFEELLYLNGKWPSKYHWFLGAHSKIPSIRKEFMDDIQKNKPKVIVYKRDFSEFGQNPDSLNALLVGFLDSDYFQIGSISSISAEYTLKAANPLNFRLAEELYFDKNRKEEIVKQLLDNGVIEKGQ